MVDKDLGSDKIGDAVKIHSCIPYFFREIVLWKNSTDSVRHSHKVYVGKEKGA